MSSTGLRYTRVTLSGCRVIRVFTLLRCHGRTRPPVLAQQNIAESVGAGEPTAEEKARRPRGEQANSPLHVCIQRGCVPCTAASNAERWFS